MNACKVMIVTDSVAQVPPELARQLGIRVVPSILMLEGRKFLDGDDFDPEPLYQRMRLDQNLQLSTSAPSAGQFFNMFLDCLDSGAESVLYIGLSSRMSGTFTSAADGAMTETGREPPSILRARVEIVARHSPTPETVPAAPPASRESTTTGQAQRASAQDIAS